MKAVHDIKKVPTPQKTNFILCLKSLFLNPNRDLNDEQIQVIHDAYNRPLAIHLSTIKGNMKIPA